jgi:hypothetical protein
MLMGFLGAGVGLATGVQADNMKSAAFDENVRRQQMKFDQWSAGVQAAAAASGIRNDSGGLNAHLSAVTQEYQRQQAFDRHQFAQAQSIEQMSMAASFLSDFGGAVMGGMSGDLKKAAAGAKDTGTFGGENGDMFQFGGGF